MKKLLALCLTVVIVLAMMPIIGASAAEGAVIFSVSDAEGYPGDEVTVAVSIGNNPGLAYSQVRVGYFAEALEVVKIETLTFAGKLSSCSPTTVNPLRVTWGDALANTTENGDIANITFKIKENAAPGEYVLKVSTEQSEVYDTAFNDVPYECLNAVIVVKCPHAEVETHPAVESTCEVQGNNEYKTCKACGEVVEGSDAKLELAPHSLVEVVDEKYFKAEATCISTATYFKHCSVCEAISDETFADPNGKLSAHAWEEVIDEKYLVSDATCTDQATYYKSCSVCKEASADTFKTGKVLAHNWVEVVDDKYLASEATCIAKATYYKSCSACFEASLETFETGEFADHSYGDWNITTKPTFDSVGYKAKECSVCYDTITEEIPARIPAEFSVTSVKGAPGETVDVVVSIDSNPGIAGASLWLDYDSNSLEIVEFIDAKLGDREVNCSEIDNDPAIIRWIGFDDNYATGALVTIRFKIKDTAVDGEYVLDLSTEQEEVFDKDFDDVLYNLIDGNFKVSSRCPDDAHVWTQVVADEFFATAATCSLKATYYLSCSECPEVANATFEAGEVDPSNHVGTTTTHDAVKSTCTVAGNDAYVTCDDCGAVVEGSDAKLPLIPHTPVEVVDDKYFAAEATCTAKATYYKSCSVCGTALDETFEVGETLEHTWANVVDEKYLITEADCVSRAVYYKSCSECGETNYAAAFVDGTFNSENHIGTFTFHAPVASTCTVQGNKAYMTCDDCGAVVKGSDAKLPLLAHTWEEVVDDKYLVSEATCVAKAVYYKSCSVCGGASEETFEIGEISGHAWVEVVDDKYLVSEATCVAKAVYYKSCSVCGEAAEETFETGDFADHAFDNDADLACNVCKYTRAPGAPTLAKANPTSIELVAVEGFEYSIDGVNWQSSNVFENLEANTEYTFYQRVAETDTHDASAASEALVAATSVVIGDINLDGKINGKDSVILIQFLNGWNVEICEPAADINGDGEVNGKDQGLLIRYLNGYEIEYFNK